MRCGVKPSLSVPFSMIGIALLVILVLASRSRSECIDYVNYSHWTGGVMLGELNDIAIQDNLILTVSGAFNEQLNLVDVTVPDDPRLISFLALQDYAYAIAVSGRYACALERFYWAGPGDAGGLATDGRLARNGQLVKGAGRFTGMEVIDIADPQAPMVVGSIFSEGLCVAMAGAYAYVGHGTAIDVIDLTVPEQPEVVNTIWLSAYVEHMAIIGPTIYTAGRGLTIIDITDPTAPVETGHVGDFRGSEVAVTGGYAYVVNDIDDPMQVIDVSDPHSPTVVATLELLGRGLFAQGDRLYVAGWDATMVFDVTDPLEPRVVAQTEWWARDVVASGDRAFISGNYGLYVLDMANESAPALLGLLEIPAADMALSGFLAYVAGGEMGLEVVNISDPENPTLVSSLDTSGITEGVALDDGLAFVADGSRGLLIAEAGNSNPEFLGWTDTPGWASDVAVQDGFAYLADGEAGLQVIDVTDPTYPWIVAHLDTPGEALHLEVDGDYVYLADYDDGFKVIDISNPSYPTVAAAVDEGLRVYDLVRVGSHVYLATMSGLVIVDVAAPTAPQIRSTTWLAGAAEGITVADGYAYLTTWAARFNVLDVSDVDAPFLVGDSPAEGYWPHSMVARDGLVYSAQGGFRIYRSQCGPAATHEEGVKPVAVRGLRAAPNPSRGRTAIRFETSATGVVGPAQLNIFDAAGRLVRTLTADDRVSAVAHEILWDGLDDRGRDVPAGIYVARISARGTSRTARLVVLK